jgi:hypothetical protein
MMWMKNVAFLFEKGSPSCPRTDEQGAQKWSSYDEEKKTL